MYNEKVDFDGTNYNYSPIKYWPNNSYNRLSFWAYCPYSASPVLYEAGTSTAYGNTSAGLPDIQFTVTDGKTDFLTSDLETDLTKPAINDPVEITFHHALSLIDVNVKKVDPTSKYTVILKSVRFDGILMTGILRSSGWAGWSGTRQNISVYENATGMALTTSAQPAGSVMPLPQSLEDESAKLHVEYSISYEGILHERTTACDVLLREVFKDALDAPVPWEKETRYTLNITITPDDPIEFTVSWSEWGTDHNYHITS